MDNKEKIPKESNTCFHDVPLGLIPRMVILTFSTSFPTTYLHLELTGTSNWWSAGWIFILEKPFLSYMVFSGLYEGI